MSNRDTHYFVQSVPNYKDLLFTKKVYIQGELAAPTIEKVYSYDYKDGGSGNSSSDPEKWKFSYVQHDKLNLKATAGNTGNTVTVYYGDDTLNADGFEFSDGNTYYIKIHQTRNYCKKLVTEKYVKVNIKPITLKMQATSSGELKLWLSNFGADKFDVRGAVKINDKTIFSYESGKYEGVKAGQWWTFKDTDYSYEQTFTSTTATIKIGFSSFRRNIGGGNDVQFGDHERSTTLAKVKGGIGGSEGNAGAAWTFICDTISGTSGRKVRPLVKFTATD